MLQLSENKNIYYLVVTIQRQHNQKDLSLPLDNNFKGCLFDIHESGNIHGCIRKVTYGNICLSSCTKTTKTNSMWTCTTVPVEHNFYQISLVKSGSNCQSSTFRALLCRSPRVINRSVCLSFRPSVHTHSFLIVLWLAMTDPLIFEWKWMRMDRTLSECWMNSERKWTVKWESRTFQGL